MVELLGMQSAPSLSSLSDQLCPQMIPLDRVLSLGQIELFDI